MFWFRIRWALISLGFVICFMLLYFYQFQKIERNHQEYQLSGKQLFKNYCTRCHKEFVLRNDVDLSFFGDVLLENHRPPFKKVLYSSDIEPLYRYLSKFKTKIHKK